MYVFSTVITHICSSSMCLCVSLQGHASPALLFPVRARLWLFILTFPWRDTKMTQIRVTQIVLHVRNISAFSVSKYVKCA